jgi:3-oxoacyl-[acyl-carrier protein] reductase
VKGQTALVTGGGRGIGRAIVAELARRGARVRFSYLADERSATETVLAVRQAGGDAAGARVTSATGTPCGSGSARRPPRRAASTILINNAGIRRDGLLALMKDEDFTDVLETNLVALFRVTREAARPMIAGRYGRIVNVASVSAISGVTGQSNYAASKGGVVALTRALAKEMSRFGVTVNAVAPGLVDTEMVADLGEEQRARILAEIPLARPGTVQEIASVIAFLASPEASYVTGQLWAVDGGLTA